MESYAFGVVNSQTALAAISLQFSPNPHRNRILAIRWLFAEELPIANYFVFYLYVYGLNFFALLYVILFSLLQSSFLGCGGFVVVRRRFPKPCRLNLHHVSCILFTRQHQFMINDISRQWLYMKEGTSRVNMQLLASIFRHMITLSISIQLADVEKISRRDGLFDGNHVVGGSQLNVDPFAQPQKLIPHIQHTSQSSWIEIILPCPCVRVTCFHKLVPNIQQRNMISLSIPCKISMSSICL